MPVYVILLNWNGWRDTADCIASLQATRDVEIRVVVCDNGSSDGSVEHLMAWAEDVRIALPPTDPSSACPGMARLDCRCLERREGESGGNADDPALVLIRNRANLGFAAGCNVGVRYALARGDATHVWLLNNDTIVRPDTLRALLAEMARDEAIGLCGSTLLYDDRRDIVDAWGGGTFNRLFATSRQTGNGMTLEACRSGVPHRRGMDYVAGASMLATRSFLDRVGLMYEGYFLYFEEIDWARRGRAKGFRLAHAAGSIVYHKHGASADRSVSPDRYGGDTDFYFLRNKILFSRRHDIWALPAVAGYVGMVLFKSLLRGHRERASMILDRAFWFGEGRRRVAHDVGQSRNAGRLNEYRDTRRRPSP